MVRHCRDQSVYHSVAKFTKVYSNHHGRKQAELASVGPYNSDRSSRIRLAACDADARKIQKPNDARTSQASRAS